MAEPITAKQWRAARALAGLSQEDIAEKATIAAQTVVNLENGQQGRPSTIEKLENTYREMGIFFTTRGVEELPPPVNEISHLGSADEGAQELYRHRAEAIMVLNTYGHPSHKGIYSDETRKLIQQTLHNNLKRDDFVSHTDVIYEMVPSFSARVQGALPGTAYEKKYRCFKLKHAALLGGVNFTVLYFPEPRPAEVFFGFGSHLSDQRGDTFFTKHPKVIEYFQKLHERLCSPENAIQIDPLTEPVALEEPSYGPDAISIGSLSDLLSEIEQAYNGKKVQRLRLMLNSAYYILPALQSSLASKLQIISCDVFFRSRKDDTKEFQDRRRNAIQDFEELELTRGIKINTKYHDVFVLDTGVLFDDQYLLIGLLVPSATNPMGFKTSSAAHVLIRRQNGGRSLIDEYVKRFDQWFNDPSLSSLSPNS